jgi:hypothetical protein
MQRKNIIWDDASKCISENCPSFMNKWPLNIRPYPNSPIHKYLRKKNCSKCFRLSENDKHFLTFRQRQAIWTHFPSDILPKITPNKIEKEIYLYFTQVFANTLKVVLWYSNCNYQQNATTLISLEHKTRQNAYMYLVVKGPHWWRSKKYVVNYM